MIVELNTNFTQEEKDILRCKDVSIQLFIDTDILYYECNTNPKYGLERSKEIIENPNRMIGVGGYYLLELEDELGEWHMGIQEQKDFSFLFFGNYGNLQEAFEAL